MASIHVKPGGAYIVRWRENGKLRGKQFTERADAEAFKRALERPIAEAHVPDGWQLGTTCRASSTEITPCDRRPARRTPAR
jgi:hypothetical protein